MTRHLYSIRDLQFLDTPPFRRLVEKIHQPLNALHIDTFWISEDGQVTIEHFD